ncbi:MAG TPA: hypothetical protein VL120_17390 [Solirubrobacteraceae bacterium]|nr:hypothetical protein [Solirubrobacteraceae bacterium]
MSRTRRCVLIALAALGATAPAARAATWTEISSGTTEDITAIEYQGPSRFWLATAAGHVFKRVGDTFVQTGSAPGVVFRDIEFQDGGAVGFAVGTNGGVLRSADNGDSWAPVAGIAGGQATLANACNLADEALGDVDSIRFAGNARAWLAAGGSQIFRTVDGATATDVGATAAGWQVINDNGVTCKIGEDVDDLFPVPGSSSVYFVSKLLGTVFFSPNALSTTATVKAASAGGGITGTRRLAGDPANPNRQWAVDSGGSGPSFVARTTDGWSTASGWTIANPGTGSITTPEGVDVNGPTVTAAGSAGMIAESTDGATFWLDPAQGAAATQDWRAVSLATPAAGAIGGTGGRLVVSSNANVLPQPPGGGAPDQAVPAPAAAGTRPPAVVTTLPQRVLPRFGFQRRSTPPVVGGAARRQGRFIVIDVLGSFRAPAGLRTATACRGTVALNVSKPRGKRRDLTDATVELARNCRYSKRLRVRRTRIGRATSLRLRVAFRGNAVVGASSVTYVVPVR